MRSHAHPYGQMIDPRAPALCRIWGHHIDQEASYHYGVDYCERCHRQVQNTGSREWLKSRIWIAQYRIGRAIHPILSYFHRCTDCGHRFNRCDESIDYLPF